MYTHISLSLYIYIYVMFIYLYIYRERCIYIGGASGRRPVRRRPRRLDILNHCLDV